jgi:hypothetical protein
MSSWLLFIRSGFNIKHPRGKTHGDVFGGSSYEIAKSVGKIGGMRSKAVFPSIH